MLTCGSPKACECMSAPAGIAQGSWPTGWCISSGFGRIFIMVPCRGMNGETGLLELMYIVIVSTTRTSSDISIG